MANGGKSEWIDALDDAFDGNSETERPETVRGLARALAAQEGSTQNAESWLRTLKKIRASGSASEEHTAAIAVALGIDRSQLPPATPGRDTLKGRLDRIEELLEVVLSRLPPPGAGAKTG